MNTKNKIVCAFLGAGLLLPVSAHARWFEIEILLFARNQDPALVAEQFPEKIAPLSSYKRIELSDFIYQPEDPCAQLPQDIAAQPLTQDLLNTQITQPCESTEAIEEPTVAPPPTSEPPLDAEGNIVIDDAAEANQPSAKPFIEAAPYSPVSPVKPVLDEKPYLLTQDMLQFTDMAEKLTEHGIYRPLLHTGWRMQIDSKRNMPVLHLVAGQNYADRFDTTGHAVAPQTSVAASLTLMDAPQAPAPTAEEQVEPSADTVLANSTPSLGELPPVWELEANLRLWLETWLHVDTQMQLRIPAEKLEAMPKEDATESISLVHSDTNTGTLVQQTQTVPYLKRYLMDQFKRVRSEEIHYLDHPLMGMIIQIRNFEPTTLTPDEATSE